MARRPYRQPSLPEDRTIKRLSDLPIELKALATAILLFTGIAVCVALVYLDASHRDFGSIWIGPSNIAATYYGPGVSYTTLLSLAHIHMLGLMTVFAVIGFIFVHCSLAPGWKILWSVLPFVAFLVDVSGWFLTKLNPGFVYVVIVGGGLFVLSLAVMILYSLYEMWLLRAVRAMVSHAASSAD